MATLIQASWINNLYTALNTTLPGKGFNMTSVTSRSHSSRAKAEDTDINAIINMVQAQRNNEFFKQIQRSTWPTSAPTVAERAKVSAATKDWLDTKVNEMLSMNFNFAQAMNATRTSNTICTESGYGQRRTDSSFSQSGDSRAVDLTNSNFSQSGDSKTQNVTNSNFSQSGDGQSVRSTDTNFSQSGDGDSYDNTQTVTGNGQSRCATCNNCSKSGNGEAHYSDGPDGVAMDEFYCDTSCRTCANDKAYTGDNGYKGNVNSFSTCTDSTDATTTDSTTRTSGCGQSANSTDSQELCATSTDSTDTQRFCTTTSNATFTQRFCTTTTNSTNAQTFNSIATFSTFTQTSCNKASNTTCTNFAQAASPFSN